MVFNEILAISVVFTLYMQMIFQKSLLLFLFLVREGNVGDEDTGDTKINTNLFHIINACIHTLAYRYYSNLIHFQGNLNNNKTLIWVY